MHVQRRGKKCLVLDPRISGFLGFVTEVALLKEHGVDQCAPRNGSTSHCNEPCWVRWGPGSLYACSG